MPDSAINAIAVKLYSLIYNDSALLALATGGVYDKTPQGTALPYVQIGEWTETRFNCFGKKGKDVTVSLHIYSLDTDTTWGIKRCADILARLNTLLDYVSFTVTGFTNTVYCRYEDAQTLMEENGLTRHIIARYRVIVQI